MITKKDILAELLEIRQLIQNDSCENTEARETLTKVTSRFASNNSLRSKSKFNLIKSFLVTFNLSNFADITLILRSNFENINIIEYAGNDSLFHEFKNLIESEKIFFKDTDIFNYRDEKYRLYFEMMENVNGTCIIVSITESAFFKPSRFHIMCDIIMDIIRSSDISRNSVYNDLFDNDIIGINKYLADNKMNESVIFLFKFININSFYKKMGLQIISELSDLITGKLKDTFGVGSSIFRFSLSDYIVLAEKKIYSEYNSGDINIRISDFNFKGIVLQYRCIKIPYNGNQSIYDVFENIYNINKSK